MKKFDELDEEDQKEILNLIEFKNRYKEAHPCNFCSYKSDKKATLLVSDILPLIAKDTIIGFCNKEGEWLTHDCYFNKHEEKWLAHHESIERPLISDLLEGKVIEIFKLGEDIVFCIEYGG